MNEFWKPVIGYERLYEISSFGNIRSLDKKWLVSQHKLASKKGKNLIPDVSNGYSHIKLWKEGKFKWFQLHQLVATAFIPNPGNKKFVNHINSNRSDNSISNLEWCTQRENLQHASRMGRLKFVNAKAVICNQTGEIFASCKDAANRIGINYHTLRAYLNGSLPNKTSLMYL